jgi:PPOX class probable F420-dependent enzyme
MAKHGSKGGLRVSSEAVEWWRGYEKLSKELEQAANRDPAAFASNPVWFDWDGEHVKIRHTKVRQRYRNMNREPQIALSLVGPENPYRYLKIRGEVTRIDEDPNLDFINSMAKKSLGMDKSTLKKYPNHQPGDERVVIFGSLEHTTRIGG